MERVAEFNANPFDVRVPFRTQHGLRCEAGKEKSEDSGDAREARGKGSEELDCLPVHFDACSRVRALCPEYLEDATYLLKEIPPFLHRSYTFGRDMESLVELVLEEKQKFQAEQANLGGEAAALHVERGKWRDSLRQLRAEFSDMGVELKRLRTYRASLEKAVADQRSFIETLTRPT